MQELAKSFSQLVDSLNGGAKGLAEALQRIAPDAWRIAVRQVVIDAACGLLAWTIIVYGILSVAHILRTCSKSASDEPESIGRGGLMTDKAAYVLWSRIVTGTGLVIYAVAVSCYMPELLNPQYEAASQMAERFLVK
jgi:hypothetical protein